MPTEPNHQTCNFRIPAVFLLYGSMIQVSTGAVAIAHLNPHQAVADWLCAAAILPCFKLPAPLGQAQFEHAENAKTYQ